MQQNLNISQYAFCGTDEDKALKDEVRQIRQAPREEIPVLNRKFSKFRKFTKPADLANSSLKHTAHTEADMADMCGWSCICMFEEECN